MSEKLISELRKFRAFFDSTKMVFCIVFNCKSHDGEAGCKLRGIEINGNTNCASFEDKQ